MFVYCFLLISLMGPGAAVTQCTNYINGSPVTESCSGDCCLDGGSYAITLDKEDVCAAVCDSEIPTSCPVKLDDNWKMHGCGVGERCCFPLEDEVPEYELGIDFDEFICSKDDYCPKTGGVFTDDTDVDAQMSTLESSITWYGDIYCYDSCYQPENLDAVDGYLPENMACTKENVRICSASKEESCIEFGATAAARVTPKDGTLAKNGELGFKLSFCGKLSEAQKPKLFCNKIDIDLFQYESDANSDYVLDDVEVQCFGIEVCKEDCIYVKSGLDWWEIFIIILVILCILVICIFLYYMCFKRNSVKPDEELISVETLDSRTIRLREVERYLDEAILQKDMAELKLTTDLVEQENFQDDLNPKYTEALRLFNELMKRSEQEKADELRKAEKDAEDAKRDLEEAEREVVRRQKDDDAAARRQSIKRRDEAKSRWMRLWPKLQILRALNAVNAEVAAKAMEEARRAREEEEQRRRQLEEKERNVRQCKKILKDGIDTGTEESLEDALKKTDTIAFQSEIMREDDELRSLYSKAKTDLEKLIREREIKEKESEKRRKEEEVKKSVRRRQALSKLDDMKAALILAIHERDIDLLNRAIEEVESNALEADVSELHKQACELLARLEKIEEVKKNIFELKRPLIAELKSMTSPPVPVHRTMIATYLLLGEDIAQLQDWNNIVILFNKSGKLSMKYRIQEFKVQNLSSSVAKLADKQILGLTADEVYEANQAASLFFDWAEMISYEKQQSELTN